MDRYVLGEQLGGGGAGVVYAAHDTLLDRPVAIKLLHSHLLDDPEPVARFQAEAQSAASLCHPAVVTLYDAGRFSDGRPFLVMERVVGRSLAAELGEGPLEEHRVLEIGARLAEGLQCAHEAGVIHRDVKPSNVLLAADGRVLLSDFGIARSLHSQDLTGVGLVVGTPAYVAPEVLAGQRAGPPADVYGLGLTLYEAITGGRPFREGSALETAIAHRDQQPPPVRSLNPTVTAATAGAIERALAKDPARRWPSAAAFGAELTRLLHRPMAGPALTAPMAGAPEVTSVLTLPPPETRPHRRAVPAGAVVLACLLVLGFILVMMVTSGSRPSAVAGSTPPPAAPVVAVTTSAPPTSTPATPPPTVLTDFLKWAIEHRDRLGRHGGEIIDSVTEVLDDEGDGAGKLLEQVRSWQRDASLDPDVASALIRALEPLAAPPTTDKKKPPKG